MRAASLLLALALGCLPGRAQGPSTIFTVSGPLTCGLRLIDAHQVQSWCYYTLETPIVTICNAITAVIILAPGTTDALRTAHVAACHYGDATTGEVVAVDWIAWQQAPPDGPIQYQVAYAVCAGPPCPPGGQDPLVRTGVLK